MNKKYTLLLLLFSWISMLPAQNPLQDILNQNKAVFGDIFDRPEHYEVQIIYTQIDRTPDNTPKFRSYEFGVNADRYFYPASTVKLPTALVALEKLNQLQIVDLDKHTPMRTGAATPPQTSAFLDPTAENLLPSVAHYIKKIFLVSDNDAYNRLYEFVGQQQLNETLWEKGFTDTRIIHRLSEPGYDKNTNCFTNPVTFYQDNQVLYHQDEVHSQAYSDLKLKQQIKGKGYENNEDAIVMQPFDFRYKNYISLQNLHDILKAVLFPGSVPDEQHFDLTESDYDILYQYMSQYPKEGKPYYDKPDGYVKFFMYGGEQDSIPNNIRIFNKVGDAYGYLTDVAYIVDFKNQIEFLVAATIHVNDNRIYNDGMYEYEEKGFPFFEQLGQLIYDFELKRDRDFVPDLSRFRRQ